MNKLLGMFIGGILTALLEKRSNDNRHSSNTLRHQLKALDRKLYLEGKKRADLIESIKLACNKK